MNRIILFVALTVMSNLMLANAQSNDTSQSQEKTPFEQIWSGKDLPNELLSAAPPNLYIADDVRWKKLWEAWRGGEPLPKVDFDKELIVFCTTTSPNHCGINLSFGVRGDVKVESVSTLIGSDAKTFNYQIGLVDRTKIKSIQSKPIVPEWKTVTPAGIRTNKNTNSDVVGSGDLKQAPPAQR